MTITEEAPPAALVGTPALNAALAAAQAEMPPITKGETGKVSGTDKYGKPFSYTYSYADLGGIAAAAYPVFGKHGLSFSSQPTVDNTGKFVLQYQLRHESGECLSGVIPLPSSAKPQDFGSVLTYYKRYAFCAVTGITPGGEDDDAQSANNEQQFDRPRSAAEAWENATPAPPRRPMNQGPRQEQRPAVTVPPLDPEDPWADKIADVTGNDDGALVREEIKSLLEGGNIDQERASRLNAVLTAKGISLQQQAAAGTAENSLEPAQEPRRASASSRIRQEDQGARKPAAPDSPDDSGWVGEFLTRLNEADENGLSGMQREIGKAVSDRTIKPDTAAELSAAWRDRRNELQKQLQGASA